MAQHTDLEQLDGLRLHALGTVDDHDSRVGSHQCAVSILREILMSRSIQNIDAVSVIIELKHRGSDGNSSLLLDLHPVGNGVLGRLPALDGTGQIDGAAIEKKLLGQGRLTGIGVGNNGEGTPLLNLIMQNAQENLL